MEKFSERLKEIRKERGLTQKQVAETIGIKEPNYRKYELGACFPAFESLLKLSECFGVSLDYLMRGKEFVDK